MALAITTRKDREMPKTHTVKERLYKTADGKVVSQGDPAARELYAVPGAEIPHDEAVEAGLVKKKSSEKKRTPAKNKGR